MRDPRLGSRICSDAAVTNGAAGFLGLQLIPWRVASKRQMRTPTAELPLGCGKGPFRSRQVSDNWHRYVRVGQRVLFGLDPPFDIAKDLLVKTCISFSGLCLQKCKHIVGKRNDLSRRAGIRAALITAYDILFHRALAS